MLVDLYPPSLTVFGYPLKRLECEDPGKDIWSISGNANFVLYAPWEPGDPLPSELSVKWFTLTQEVHTPFVVRPRLGIGADGENRVQYLSLEPEFDLQVATFDHMRTFKLGEVSQKSIDQVIRAVEIWYNVRFPKETPLKVVLKTADNS